MSPIRTRDCTLRSGSWLSTASSNTSGRGRRARFWGLLPSELVTVNLNASACIEHCSNGPRPDGSERQVFEQANFAL
jgi:hypothetical protein